MKFTFLLTNKIQRTLVAGTVALLLATPAAQAAIFSVSFAGSPVTIPDNIGGMYFNFVTGAQKLIETGDFDFNAYNNEYGLTFYGNDALQGILASGTPGALAQATLLSFGASIAAAGQYNQFQTRGNAFHLVTQGYVGVRFLNESTGLLNYGWALMSTTVGNGFPAALLGYGYENTGLSILAGQTAASTSVPEPGSFALFGLGLAGMMNVRCSRRHKRA